MEDYCIFKYRQINGQLKLQDMAEQLADPQTHQQKELTPIMKAVLEMDSKIPEDLRALGVDDVSLEMNI